MQRRILTLVAARGGQGRTSVAAGIALAAAARGCRTVLVDMDMGARSLDACLGCEDRVVYDLGDLLAGRRDVSGVALSITERLWLIPGVYHASPLTREGWAETLLASAADMLAAELVVADTSAVADPVTQACVACADEVLLVTACTPRALDASASFAAQLSDAGRPARLLLNRVVLTEGADIRSAIDTVGIPLIGIVPEEERMEASLASPDHSLPSGTFAAFSNIAARLAGGEIPLLAGVAAHRRAFLSV